MDTFLQRQLVDEIVVDVKRALTYEAVSDALAWMANGQWPWAFIALPKRIWVAKCTVDLEELNRLVCEATAAHAGSVLSLDSYEYGLTKLPWECTTSTAVQWEGRLGIILRRRRPAK